MKKLMMVVAATVAAVSSWGAESISVKEVANHYPWDGKVDCVVTLSGAEKWCSYDGVFELSVKKDGESVSRVVTNELGMVDGTYTNTFDCTSLFGAGYYPNGGVSVALVKGVADATGTPIGITGDVLVIDVSAGKDAETYPTAEISSVDIGTFNCDVYKTDKIVLKRIPAGAHYCQPDDHPSTAVSQQLTTKGFYIGVFPVTQRQYELVMGTNTASFATDAEGNVAAQRPEENLSWNMIRGSVAAGTEITASSPDSFLKRLVAKTGLSGFDLPTEAQWEMACRAGATAEYGAYWNGTASVELTSSNLGEAAWYLDNASSTTHAVGGKRPNLWGLYDMQGNVFELARDVFETPYSPSYVDVPCPSSTYEKGENRPIRGGSWKQASSFSRPSVRYNAKAIACNIFFGFRLSKTLP